MKYFLNLILNLIAPIINRSIKFVRRRAVTNYKNKYPYLLRNSLYALGVLICNYALALT